MDSLKKNIISRLQKLAALMVVLSLLAAAFLQMIVVQNQARENAQAAFHQIAQVLEANTRELENISAEYRETCLLSAESIAYMIQYHPEILGDIEEFRKIARMMEVDEIHIFDKTGRIFTGTHPEYYDFTFETGEQIGFFKPLLKDKSLRLSQDITPNTAEGVLVQYSALWSADGEFIVQVGMYPETIMEYTDKNELSYIFSLLQGSPGVNFYAIDGETGLIRGSTSGSDNGKTMTELGLNPDAISHYKHGGQATVNGVDSFCVLTDMNGTLIAYVISNDSLYRNMPLYTLLLAGCLGLIVFIIVSLVWRFIRSEIVKSIDRVNESLGAVSDGNLDERVNVQTSLEFAELSEHINDMIRSLLATTDKMSVVLDHAKMRIGVYEYSTRMKTVRFTEHVPEILGWSSRTRSEIASDYHRLQRHLEKLVSNPVAGEKNTFQLEGGREVYIKLEEVVNGSDTLGILMDVTDDILTRRRIEQERDIDMQTGLYNRRGMERQLEAVFQEDMGYGALVVIDSDNLKFVNDKYGHTVGDWYIKCVADAISPIGSKKSMAARQGGDEFVLLLYGYDSEDQVREDLDELIYAQKNTKMSMKDGGRFPVGFSFGYVMTKGRTDYAAMINEADEQMYEAKRLRKQASR